MCAILYSAPVKIWQNTQLLPLHGTKDRERPSQGYEYRPINAEIRRETRHVRYHYPCTLPVVREERNAHRASRRCFSHRTMFQLYSFLPCKRRQWSRRKSCRSPAHTAIINKTDGAIKTATKVIEYAGWEISSTNITDCPPGP